MSTKTTIPISEARRRIFDIAEDVQTPSRYYTLTEKGRPKAVLMSAEEFESWVETVEVLHDVPTLDREIAAAKRDIRTGRYKTFSTLRDLKADWGISLATTTKRHGVHALHKTKRPKAVRKTAAKR